MFGRGMFGSQLGRSRLFERGELKYAILDLLAAKPRHGYEVIQALGERYRPFYTPSAGAVYPTLPLLEDAGAVTAAQVDGKKVYTITAAGRQRLTEHRATLDAIRARLSVAGDAASRGELGEAMHDARELGRLLFRGRGVALTPDQLSRVRAVLRRARQELEAILTGAAPATL
jgi:DNA-binding PadR family transcriptional regulator